MSKIKELKAELKQIRAEAHAITKIADEEKRDLTAEELAEIKALVGETDDDANSKFAKVKAQLAYRQRIEDAAKDIMKESGNEPERTTESTPSVSVVSRHRGSLKAFVGEDAERDAHLSGQWFAAVFGGNEKAKQWCADNGVSIRAAHSGSDNAKGGFTVPQPLESAIIRLVEQYGVFRSNIGSIWPMPGGNLKVPKRAGGFTTYFVGENAEITASDMAFAQVQLVAKKLGVLTQVSSELLEDSAVALADLLAVEFAYAFAQKEDDCGFNGDGTSTYGGIVGLKNALQAGSISTAEANDNTLAELTMTPFHAACGLLKQYPGAQPAWYMHSSVWFNGIERLTLALGGNNNLNAAGGMPRQFMGYPVRFSQVMPSGTSSTDLASTIVAYLGDLSMSCSMGDTRGITFSTDTSKYFAEDALAVKATERFDLNVHDRGTASASGGIIAVKMNTA